MITLRLSDTAYEAVKRYADADQQSMNSWIENFSTSRTCGVAVRHTTSGCERTLMQPRSARRGRIATSTSQAYREYRRQVFMSLLISTLQSQRWWPPGVNASRAIHDPLSCRLDLPGGEMLDLR